MSRASEERELLEDVDSPRQQQESRCCGDACAVLKKHPFKVAHALVELVLIIVAVVMLERLIEASVSTDKLRSEIESMQDRLANFDSAIANALSSARNATAEVNRMLSEVESVKNDVEASANRTEEDSRKADDDLKLMNEKLSSMVTQDQLVKSMTWIDVNQTDKSPFNLTGLYRVLDGSGYWRYAIGSSEAAILFRPSYGAFVFGRILNTDKAHWANCCMGNSNCEGSTPVLAIQFLEIFSHPNNFSFTSQEKSNPIRSMIQC